MLFLPLSKTYTGQLTALNNLSFHAKLVSTTTSIPPQLSIPPQDNRLYFSNRPIEKKSLQKDLGVAISDDLKWNEHTKKAATKARNVLWMVKRSSPMLPTAAKLNIYKSMIIRTLIYGSNTWNPNIQCCKTLEKIQKESLKWVNGDRNYPESLKKCKILPLTLYLQLQDLLTMSKCLNGHYDYNFNDFICLRDSDRSLRSNDYLRFDNKRPNKKVCRDSFFYRTGALVNRLPKTVNFKNPEGLKRRLLGYFWWYFNNKYNEIVSNTWRIWPTVTNNERDEVPGRDGRIPTTYLPTYLYLGFWIFRILIILWLKCRH